MNKKMMLPDREADEFNSGGCNPPKRTNRFTDSEGVALRFINSSPSGTAARGAFRRVAPAAIEFVRFADKADCSVNFVCFADGTGCQLTQATNAWDMEIHHRGHRGSQRKNKFWSPL